MEIERFRVVSDDGSFDTVIIVHQELIDVATRANPSAVIPGLKTAETIDGFACNYLGDGRFEIIDDPLNMGRVVRRVP